MTIEIGHGLQGTITAVTATVGADLTAHGEITADVQGTITAVGTITAQTKGILTAQVQGGTATVAGTLTAQVQNVVTAQIQGGTAGGTFTAAAHWLSGLVLSAQANTGTGQALDMRDFRHAGYLHAWSSGCSASASVLASYDSAAWMVISAIGLPVNGTATAQLSGLYPFIAGRVDNAYNNGGGATAITATVSMHVTKA